MKFEQVDFKRYGLKAICKGYIIHVLIDDVKAKASEMIDIITDESWITKLSAINKASFKARAERTVTKLANDIFGKVADSVTADFGEYMVSLSAQEGLVSMLNHTRVPLAEVIKEKVTGNPGFDFHTESNNPFITFGEAKYSASRSPYKDALEQINGFIYNKKDVSELELLQYFVSDNATNNAINNKKAYAAAFSINSKNPLLIFDKAIKSECIMPLLQYPELYLIGVEVA